MMRSYSLQPLDPRLFPERFHALGESDFAITHAEHAYESLDAKWLDSPVASEAQVVADWISLHAGIDLELWMTGLGVFLAYAIGGWFVLAIVLRTRLSLIVVPMGVFAGGALGNQIELGLGDVTDWIWIGGGSARDWLGSQWAVFNFADLAIVSAELVLGFLFVLYLIIAPYRLLEWAVGRSDRCSRHSPAVFAW